MQSAKCKIKGENFDTIISVGERLAAPAWFYGQSGTPVPTVYDCICLFHCLGVIICRTEFLNLIVGGGANDDPFFCVSMPKRKSVLYTLKLIVRKKHPLGHMPEGVLSYQANLIFGFIIRKEQTSS